MSEFDQDYDNLKTYYDQLRAMRDKVQEFERMQTQVAELENHLEERQKKGIRVQLPPKNK